MLRTVAARALLALLGLTAAYGAVLAWLGSGAQLRHALPALLQLLPVLLGLSLLSYGLRYARWRWLLRNFPHRLGPWHGLLAYLAGFAFTISPAKLGELVRIRYHAPHGVQGPQVFSAFLFERATDLVAVLLLACLTLTQPGLLVVAAAFVGLLLALIVGLACWPRGWTGAAERMERSGHPRLARLLRGVRDGLAGSRAWWTAPDLALSLLLALAAWSASALSFALLLAQLGAMTGWLAALSTYPLAMLVGSASMLPGGIGSTELAIVAVLRSTDVPMATAALAAVAIRVVSLWFAVACGVLAVSLLEGARA